ncbi:MAG: S53 family peptidase, partial [Acidimicrobiales bacterium]
AARFGASPAEVSSLRASLRSKGLAGGRLASNGLSLAVTTTVATAERAFHTSMAAERLASGRLAYANVSAATFPPGVSGVLGLDDLAQAHAALTHAALTRTALTRTALTRTAPTRTALAEPRTTETSLPVSSCVSSSTANSPSSLAAAYGLGGLYSQGVDGTGMTVALFELADFAPSDVAAFASCEGISGESVSVVAVDGGAAVGAGTTEATADIEDLMSLAPGAAIVAYEGPNTTSGLYDTYSAIISADRAQVVATSWGICEAQNDPSLMQAENTLFEQAATQGQTILAASGDSGSQDCYGPPASSDTSLAVDDPSSQPYVTGVGGTSLSSTSPRTEAAWNSDGGAGGGGISSVWPMPSWQTGAVTSQSSGLPCAAASGDCRQVPDVSASADPNYGYLVYCTAGDCSGRGWGTVGGTSMASPLWAAVVALDDQSCATSNRAGLINPVLYGAGRSDLNDVTSGNNDLNGTHPGDYNAGTGYDMATGLGSPDATALASALCASSSRVSAGGSAGGSSGGGGTGTTTTTTTSTTTTSTTTTTTTAPTTTTTTAPTTTTTTAPPVVAAPAPAVAPGYRFVASDGGVFDFGTAAFEGSGAGTGLGAPVVGMAAAPGGSGYWLVTSTGRVLAFGTAANLGSLGGLPAGPIVGMAATPDGGGYWLVSSAGAVYSFGDAAFHGSAAGLALAAPVVGMAVDPVTGGYWLVAGDGGIFSYDAPFYGSAGAIHLAKPIVGMSAMPDGRGYRFVASDGGVFDFGDAAFYGSAGAIRLARPVVGMSVTPDGAGYWLVASDGGIFSYGDAPFLGSTGAIRLAQPIVGMAGI